MKTHLWYYFGLLIQILFMLQVYWPVKPNVSRLHNPIKYFLHHDWHYCHIWNIILTFNTNLPLIHALIDGYITTQFLFGGLRIGVLPLRFTWASLAPCDISKSYASFSLIRPTWWHRQSLWGRRGFEIWYISFRARKRVNIWRRIWKMFWKPMGTNACVAVPRATECPQTHPGGSHRHQPDHISFNDFTTSFNRHFELVVYRNCTHEYNRTCVCARAR